VGDEQVKNTLKVAEALRDERDAIEKKAKEVLEEASFSKAAVPTIY
jgi:hypothetical protein